jgi:two-component system phosphate regulon response regulator OmpR
MTVRLLMIEDDRRLAGMVKEYLSQHGLQLTHAATATEGLALLKRESFALLLLDLMLPDGDGLALCRQVRQQSPLPIIMLTARGDPMDRVVGLELGADDYVPKPFEPRELLARIRAVLRRQHNSMIEQRARQVLCFGQLEIDTDARIARVRGNEMPLTSHQFELLKTLAEHAGRVLSREQLLDLAKGEVLDSFDRSIDVHIARIRAVIEDDPKHPRRIITVRGAGYVFAAAQD